MNHVDVLFPEPMLPSANDSFYSIQSAQTASSAYSSYSQEVKYIFEPKTSPRQSSRGSQESYRSPREPWVDHEENHSLHDSPRSSHDSTGSQKSPRIVNGSTWTSQGLMSPRTSPSTSASSWTYQEVSRQASWSVQEEDPPPPYEASLAPPTAWNSLPSSGGGQQNLAWAVTGRPPPYRPHFGSVSSEAGSRAPISTTTEIFYPPPRAVPDSYTHPVRLRHPPLAHHPVQRTDSDARRRTWSPNTFERAMRMAPNFQLRSYRSNEQLDLNEGENHYEELDTLPGRNGIGSVMSPPKIAPVSGRLHQPVKPPLIKPVAFKPVQPAGGPPRYGNTAPGPTPLRACPRSPRVISPTSSIIPSYSPASYHTDASRSFTEYSPKGGERTVASGVPVPQSFSSSFSSEAFVGTPSPSDSGLGEIETMLRDKDAEIANLRSTLEQNETAILRVCEEKRQAWAAELREAGSEWERALRQQQQRALKMEQALLLQLYRLQQERKSARVELEQTHSEQTRVQQTHDQLVSQHEELKQKCDQQQKDNVAVSAKLEESQWEVCQKAGEISLLKNQLKEGQDGTANRNAELLSLKNQIKNLTTSSQEKDSEIERLKSELEKTKQELSHKTTENESLQQQVDQCSKGNTSGDINLQETDRLRAELLQCRSDLEKHRENYFSERDQWLDEKNKVIRYQKHLQLNYVQMYRKNKLLEKEVEQLLVEIENKDLKLMGEEDAQLNQESTC